MSDMIDAIDRCHGALIRADALGSCAMTTGFRDLSEDDKANYVWAMTNEIIEARAGFEQLMKAIEQKKG